MAGLTASVWLSGTLEGLLYEIRPTDPGTLLVAATGLLGIVACAALLPATRTGRVALASALRVE
jgi:hypothetical protein